MSLSRSLLNEFRPILRLFDEVSHTRPSYRVLSQSPFDRRLDGIFSQSRQPFVDLSEKGNDYIIEAEIPGVKKEQLEVSVGDNGRSLTIEGRTFARSTLNPEPITTTAPESTGTNNGSFEGSGDADILPTSNETSSAPVSSKRETAEISKFVRTIWLPRSVNASKISGSLADGILTLRVPKAEEQGSFKVDIQ